MRKLITDVDQVTPDWLTGVLHEKGHLSQGRVIAIRKQPGATAISVVVPLELSYSEDAPKSAPSQLILKMPGPDSGSDGKEEVKFYNAIVDSAVDLPVIRCYEAVYSPETGGFHLLMEDLSDTHFAHPPSQLPPPQAHAEQIVDALARIHTYWWDDPRLGKKIGQLPDQATVKSDLPLELRPWAAQTLPEFAGFLGDRLSEERRQVYGRVLSSLPPKLLKRLRAGRGLTLIHGDPHIGNFLYPRDPNTDTVRILDWKSWSIGLGADDLAHMMAVFWFPERRERLEQELLRRYHNRLLAHGVRDYDWQTCWDDYRLSVMRYLFYPVWQWSVNMPPDIWWHHLERVMLAFEDLNCAELLTE